ncbi:hypothetical protein ACVIHD_001737 [Bradyrhizobium embrapense]
MEDWLKRVAPDSWYKIVAVTGGLSVVTAISAGASAGILIGLGLLGIGCGEWTSRITVQSPTPAGNGLPAGMARTTTRVWRPLGILLDTGGLALLLIGLHQIIR